MERELHAWEFLPSGTEGYAKAEVTVGGVDTAALDPRTLESRAVPGLYFVGEVVDVTAGWGGTTSSGRGLPGSAPARWSDRRRS